MMNQIANNLVDIEYIIVDQHLEIEGNESCIEFLLKANPILYNTEVELNQLYQINSEDVDLINKLEQILDLNQWEKFKAKAQKILKGMRFLDKSRKVTELSGSWRMCLALCKGLLVEPTILFLDEPTNHLDFEATLWLNNYLEEYKKALVICTHYKPFIENVGETIWFVNNFDNCGVKVYKIKYSIDSLSKYIKEKTNEIAEKNMKIN